MLEEKFLDLQGGIRPWWDVSEQRMIQASVLYLAQGCPDWGETKGMRNGLCTFCALPYAAANYRKKHYMGQAVSQAEHLSLFRKNFRDTTRPEEDIHTVMVFNAGSFLATEANAPATQVAIIDEAANHPTIRRVVVESRAELITEESIRRLTDVLNPAGKRLTIRIGIETQDDHLRTKVLRKGHSRKQLYEAMRILRKFNVDSGGYVLLNSAPGLNPLWAVDETQKTIDWILGDGPEQLGMNEAYYCSTNVGPGTPLEIAWRDGKFKPASLWMVYKVLSYALVGYPGRVHLLPFKDEPEFLAVPSNHRAAGIPQNLSTAAGCDLAFHKMFEVYRQTMDKSVLPTPVCACRPEWV